MKNLKKIFVVLALILLPSLALADFDVSLKYGSRGPAVIELQDFLQDQGFYKAKLDGKFGLGTLRAVRNWQSANELVVDGYFGKASRAKAKTVLADLINQSDATEQAEEGTISPPVVQPINPPQNTPVTPPVASVPPVVVDNTPKEVPWMEVSAIFTDVNSTDVLFRFGAGKAGDKITATVNGTTQIKVLEFNPSVDQAMMNIGGLQAQTKYPYTVKIERGNVYTIKTGTLTTLKVGEPLHVVYE